MRVMHPVIYINFMDLQFAWECILARVLYPAITAMCPGMSCGFAPFIVPHSVIVSLTAELSRFSVLLNFPFPCDVYKYLSNVLFLFSCALPCDPGVCCTVCIPVTWFLASKIVPVILFLSRLIVLCPVRPVTDNCGGFVPVTYRATDDVVDLMMRNGLVSPLLVPGMSTLPVGGGGEPTLPNPVLNSRGLNWSLQQRIWTLFHSTLLLFIPSPL